MMNDIQLQIEQALRDIGIEPGDVVMLHADATPIMRVAGFDALPITRDAFMNVLGDEGALLIPTFNYDFCKGAPYNHEHTPSQVGLFSTYMLNEPGATRTFHPIYSFVVKGWRRFYFLRDSSFQCFGEDSIFGRFQDWKGKIVFFNTDFRACTFIHHIEQAEEVDYRHFEYFLGNVQRGSWTKKDFAVCFFARRPELNLETNLEPMGEYLLERGLMRRVDFGDGAYVMRIRSDVLYHATALKLYECPRFLTKEAT